jgi:hypothetical protein
MWSFLPLPVLRGRVGEGARAGDALGKPPPYPPPEYRGRGKEGFTDPHAIALNNALIRCFVDNIRGMV